MSTARTQATDEAATPIAAAGAARAARMAPEGPSSLIGLSRAELAGALQPFEADERKRGLRARQLWHWIYGRGAREFGEMSTLATPLRIWLSDRYTLERPAIVESQASQDGTHKWLLRFADAQEVETVYIPEDERGAVCLSSQVGCTLTCAFCRTGTQRLVRNLSAAEMLGQLLVARDVFGEWPSTREGRMISNIVMMGMGEPLLNFENVKRALAIAMDAEGIALSRRKITLSTSGIVPLIERCGREIGCNLAVSLHAVSDELRDRLVPINRKYPIAALLKTCRSYPGAHNARRITFEYVMLKGVNDSLAEARELARLLRGIPSKVNLIPFNPWPGAPFECSSAARIAAFADALNASGTTATVRTPRGRDILAACGQLKSASVKLRAFPRA